MADAFCANGVSTGFSEGDIGSPRRKPEKQISFDTEGDLFGSFGFSTPARKVSSHSRSGQGFSSPNKKGHFLDGDDFFDSFNMHTPARKGASQSYEMGLTPSTAAPTPERPSTLASPWSPYSSRVSSLEYEMPPFLPSPPDAMLLPGVRCSMDDCWNFGDELLAQPASLSTLGFSETDKPEVTTPPTTPRNTRRTNTVGDLAPCAPRREPAPPLLKALQANSINMVRDAVSEDAEVLNLPFFDHNMEPPICSAARLRCDPEIVSHLLESRADVNATNEDGLTALDIVRRPAHRRGEDIGSTSSIFAFTSTLPPKQSRDETECLLVAAGGCSSHSPGSTFGHDSCAHLRLPGEHEVACQLDASSVLPTLAPCEFDVEDVKALLENLLPLNVGS